MHLAYQILSKQLGRPLTVDCQIVVFCPQSFPAVTENKPWDNSGRPFPTLYWLSCPLAVKKASQLEAAGLIKKLAQKLAEDASFKHAFSQAVKAYQQRRQELADDKKETFRAAFWQSGVGGSRNVFALKCLHAHLAHFLATKQNPVGEVVFKQLNWQGCYYCEKLTPSSSH